MRYRCADAAGETYFFTVNPAECSRTWLVEHVNLLRSGIREAKRQHPFHIDAMVILPDHLHSLWTFPVNLQR